MYGFARNDGEKPSLRLNAARPRCDCRTGHRNRRGTTMVNPPVQSSSANSIIPILLPCVLIGHFLWNVLTPAHEFPLRTEQVMTMLFDLGMLIGLFSFRRAMPAPLFWIALVA